MPVTRSYALNPISVGLNSSTLYEPQRTNHFEVYIYLPAALANGDAALIETYRKYITLATQSFSLPSKTITPIEIPYGNTKIKLAGGVEYGGADSLSCHDYIGADVEGIIYAWQDLVASDETGQVGWAYTYKTDAKVLEYSGDGECLASWILRGVWPSAVNYGSSLDKGSTDVKKIDVTITYDIAYRKFGQSTRSNHAQAATTSAQNMLWKDQSGYADSNNGGPITPIKDSFS